LAIISNLNPDDSSLSDNYAVLLKQYEGLRYKDFAKCKKDFPMIENTQAAVEGFVKTGISSL